MPERPREGSVAIDARAAGAATGDAPARTRPLLRGVFHAGAAVAVLPAAAWLYAQAPSRAAELGALVYGSSLVFLFTVSAIYHRVLWTDPVVRRAVGRVDHSAIFALIAGTYTPFCLLLGAPTGTWLLVTVWASAALGMAVVVFLPGTPKPVRSALYVLLGWLVVPFLPRLGALLGLRPFALLVAGGALYTVGAVIYAARRPDPWPRVFGFHEIFHLLVVAAAALQFAAVAEAVRLVGAVG
ncbi:MAG TPA: hemolysin III family protein [Anaeromyxobacteraceae bacterium]|nr:hemolysin III family protein [Anaeromyxobacteraceae bacterium]